MGFNNYKLKFNISLKVIFIKYTFAFFTSWYKKINHVSLHAASKRFFDFHEIVYAFV